MTKVICTVILIVLNVAFVGTTTMLFAKYRITKNKLIPHSPTCCTDRPVYGEIKIISSKKIKSPFQCSIHCTQFNLTDTDSDTDSGTVTVTSGGSTVRSSCTFFNFKTNITDGSNSCELYSSEYACFNMSVINGCTLYQRDDYDSLLKCVGLERQIVVSNVDECILPFSYRGDMFYNCSDLVNSTNPCNQTLCLNYKRKLVLCRDPENFNGTNHTSYWSIPNQATPYLGFSIFDWLVILQRENRVYNFYLNWASYRDGFGIFPNNFWMGLEKVHQLTNTAQLAGRQYSMRIEYFVADNWFTDEWKTFYLESELKRYTLRLSGYFGDSGYDIMTRTDSGGIFMQNNMPFSTNDKDSTGPYQCCSKFKTAGWFSSCCHIDFFGCSTNFDTFVFNDWFQIQALRMSIRQY